MGRPSKYTESLANEICERLSLGESLTTICQDDHIPNRKTILDWLADPRYADFTAKCARARDLQADSIAEKVHEIGDGVLAGKYDPHAAKVAISAYQWRASKLAPKKYGDRLAVGGTPDGDPIKSELVIRMVPSPKQIEGDDDEG